MSKNNLAIGIVHEICPICGKSMNEAIVMNNKLIPKYAKQVEEINGKAIGISKDACEECTKHKDECIYVIGIDPNKSDNSSIQGLYRTGQIVGVKKEAEIVEHCKKFIQTLSDGSQYCLIDNEVGKTIGLW